MLSMTVFQAFPNALEKWEIGKVKYSTITGNQPVLGAVQDINVIVDRGDATSPNPGNTAQGTDSDTLIYCQPSEMPTTDTSELVARYMVNDGKNTYAIIDAGLGKNQENGVIEHIELRLRQNGLADE